MKLKGSFVVEYLCYSWNIWFYFYLMIFEVVFSCKFNKVLFSNFEGGVFLLFVIFGII